MKKGTGKFLLIALIAFAIMLLAGTAMAENIVSPRNLTYNGTDQQAFDIVSGKSSDCYVVMQINGQWVDYLPLNVKVRDAGEYPFKIYGPNTQHPGYPDVCYQNGTLRVKKASINISWSGQNNYTYNRDVQKPTYTVNGLYLNQVDVIETVTDSTGAVVTRPTDVGRYRMTLSFQSKNSIYTNNYNYPSNVYFDYNIVQLPLTFTWTGNTKVYDGEDWSPVPSVVRDDYGTILTDSIGTIYTVSYTGDRKNVTNRQFTALATVIDPNYKVRQGASASFRRASKGTTVSIATGKDTFVYNAQNQMPSLDDFVIGGVVAGDTVKVTSFVPEGNWPNVGVYSIDIRSIQYDNPNYYADRTDTGLRYTVTPLSIDDAAITLSDTQLPYEETGNSVSVTGVTAGGLSLTPNDYTVSGDLSATALGEYTVTVTGKGNFKGSNTADWNIDPAPMNVVSDGTTVVYDGEAYGISVKVNKPATGATILYGDTADTCTLTECPTQTEPGSLTVYFKITAENYSDYEGVEIVTVNPIVVDEPVITLSQDTYIFNLKENEPGVTVTYDDGKVIAADEYIVEYADNINAGTATVSVRNIPTGHYRFSGKKEFTIEPKPVTEPVITLSDEIYDYDQKEHTPDVTVADEEILIDAEEYTITYTDNINAGTATVTITDKEKGNYTVSGKKTFTINPLPVLIEGLEAEDKIYDGSVKATPAGEAKVIGVLEGDEVTVIAGTAAFETAKAEASKNVYFSDYKLGGAQAGNYDLIAQPTTSADIFEKGIPVIGITAVNRDYEPENNGVTVVGGTAQEVVEGDEVSVDLSNAMGFTDDANAGENKPLLITGVRLSGSDADNYYVASVPTDVTVTINKLPNTVVVRNTAIVKIDGNTTDLSANVSLPTGDVSYAITGALEGCSVDEVTGVFKSGLTTGICTVTVSVTGDINFLPATAEIAVTVTEKDVQNLVFGSREINKIYGDPDFTNPLSGAETELTYTVTTGKNVAVVADDGTVTIIGVGKAIISVSAAETQTYAGETADYVLTVEKADALKAAPTARTDLVYNGKAQDLAVAGRADGGTMMYALGLSEVVAPTSGWSTVIPQATDAEDWYVWYRVDADRNHFGTDPTAIRSGIAPKSIMDAKITLDSTQMIYDGTEQTVMVMDVSLGGKSLPADCYDVTGDSATVLGKYDVTITGKGNYGDMAKARWEIVENAMTVKAANVTAEYDGAPHGITVSVIFPSSGATIRYGLAEGEYTMEEAPTLTEHGTLAVYYQVTAEGFDDYEGLANVTVTAAPAQITGPEAKSGLIYNGEPQEVITAANVTGGTVLYALGESDTIVPFGGWSIYLPKATDAGTWYVWYRVDADENHSDIEPKNIAVTIGPKSISKAAVTLNTSQVKYTGGEIAVKVTGVTVDGLTLGAGEYTVTGNTGTEIADYTATVTGKGNYTDSVTAKWEIVENPMTVEASNVTVPYDGMPHGISLNVTDPAQGAKILYGTEEGKYTLTEAPTLTDTGILTVYFETSADGYDNYEGVATVTVTKVDAVVAIIPTAVTGLVENDESQELIAAGTAAGGLMVYALGDGSSAPNEAAYTEAIPTAVTAGEYSVWYMARGDVNHNDTAPAELQATIAEKEDPRKDRPDSGLWQDENGVWVLLKEKEVATGYTGLYYDNVYGWWLVREGKVDWEYDGLFCDKEVGWWLIKDGTVRSDYNGLYNDATYGWWLIKDGGVDFAMTGLYNDANCGWWLISSGRVCFEWNGLWGDPVYGWWLVNGGTVDFSYSGLYNDANCGWWLLNGGAVDFRYTGLYNDANCGWWLIGSGSVAFDYTGLWNDANCGWWLIGNGTVVFDYTGLWNDPNCGWWLIYNGSIVFDYNGLFNDPVCGWWLISRGTIAWDYTGVWNDAYYGPWYISGGKLVGPAENYTTTGLFYDFDGVWRLYTNGAVNFGYTGLYNDSTFGWWLVENGVINFNYTGLFADQTYGCWLVEKGGINFGYTGEYEDAVLGKQYIENGKMNAGPER